MIIASSGGDITVDGTQTIDNRSNVLVKEENAWQGNGALWDNEW